MFVVCVKDTLLAAGDRCWSTQLLRISLTWKHVHKKKNCSRVEKAEDIFCVEKTRIVSNASELYTIIREWTTHRHIKSDWHITVDVFNLVECFWEYVELWKRKHDGGNGARKKAVEPEMFRSADEWEYLICILATYSSLSKVLSRIVSFPISISHPQWTINVNNLSLLRCSQWISQIDEVWALIIIQYSQCYVPVILTFKAQ